MNRAGALVRLASLAIGFALASQIDKAEAQTDAVPSPESIRRESTVLSIDSTLASRPPAADEDVLAIPARLPETANVLGVTAGVFGWPFSPYLNFNRKAQYFLQWNRNFKKYHAGDDWNGNGGGSSDLNLPLYAIADGIVQFKDDTAARDAFGKVLIVRHTLPNGAQIDSVYAHVQKIFAGGRGAKVSKGMQIATIGDANGYYRNAAHLHWELRRDIGLTNADPEANPYYYPLTIQAALRYTSPSLFVDDRESADNNSLTYREWSYLTWNFNAPSSTAYVQYNGVRYSLKKAVDAGLVYGYIYEQRNGKWHYYPDIADVFFGAKNTYAIYSYVQGASLTVLVPGNRYRADRARQDIVSAASRDRRFRNVRTETYAENIGWDADFELRYMGIDYVNFKGISGIASIYQATSKANPLERYTTFFDPDTDQQTSWIQVDRNTLE